MKGGAKRFQIGQIVLVNFPFQEDQSLSKRRPALIVSINDEIATMLPITSQEKYKGRSCYIEIQLVKLSYINVCIKALIPLAHIEFVVSSLPEWQLALVLQRYNQATKS